jgi:hypothetical protein
MDSWQSRFAPAAVGPLLAALMLVSSAGAQTANTCVDCHSALDAPLKVTQDQFAQDIHFHKGLTCASCHGGDPTKSDMDAMSKAAGFRGKPDRKAIPALCGKCHSDAALMRQYNPSLRTDQLSQYQTSVHGRLLAKARLLSASIATGCIACGRPATRVPVSTPPTWHKCVPAVTRTRRI